MNNELPSFSATCRAFFGFRPGTGLRDFAEELKALTMQDKIDIYEGFKAQGIVCKEPATA